MIKFMHFRSDVMLMERPKGVTTGAKNRKVTRIAACTVAYDIEDNMLRVATAWCSPRDMFCRKEGRRIASERLIAGSYHKSAARWTHTPFDVADMVNDIIRLHQDEMPQWAQNAYCLLDNFDGMLLRNLNF